MTGGTGFVGRPTVAALEATGHDVVVVARHEVDLLEPGAPQRLATAAKATHLVHVAWYAEPGRFWTDVEANLAWLAASVDLVRAFCAAGGEHVVAVGTAVDAAPASTYAAAKHALHVALGFAGTTLAWARLHQPYGPGEDARRLLPHVTRTLASGDTFTANTSGAQERDFVHVTDVGCGLAALVGAPAGTYDVGTGRATAVRDVVLGIARRLDAVERVRFPNVPLPSHEPPRLVADPAPLRALGWSPQVDLDAGLDELVAAWTR